MPNLDILKLLGTLRSANHRGQADGQYQESFADQGHRKAERYLNFLRENIPADELGSYAVLSIGGADGSELDFVKDHTGVRTFLLNEISSGALAVAYQKKAEYAARNCRLEIFPGDIWLQLEQIEQYLALPELNYLKGIVVSAQSVLHEIAYRSAAPNLTELLVRLTSLKDNLVFVSTEPSGNTGLWPEEVFVQFSNVSADDAVNLAKYIREKFYPTLPQPYISRNRLRANCKIALEAIYKVSFDDGNERLKVELDECLTAFPSHDIIRFLGSEDFQVEHSFHSSSSFKRNFAERVRVTSLDAPGQLQCPPSFVTILAIRKNIPPFRPLTCIKEDTPTEKEKPTILFHLFDHHVLDFLGLSQQGGPHFDVIRNAFRICYLAAEKLFIPSSSFIESSICRKILNEFSSCYSLGRIFLIGNALSFAEYVRETKSLYKKDGERWNAYASSSDLLHPPFQPRKLSATSELLTKWMDIGRSFEPPKLLHAKDPQLIRAIEQKWDGLPVELGGRAVIPEYVSEIILGPNYEQKYATQHERLSHLICVEYFNSIAEEFKATYVSSVPYFLVPGFATKTGTPLDYTRCLRLLQKVGLLERVRSATGEQLETIRASRQDIIEALQHEGFH